MRRAAGRPLALGLLLAYLLGVATWPAQEKEADQLILKFKTLDFEFQGNIMPR